MQNLCQILGSLEEFRYGIPPVSSPSGKNGGRMVIFVKKISIQGGNADRIKLRL